MFYYCNSIKFWAALFVALAVLIFPPAGLGASADKGSPLIFCPANFVPGSKSAWKPAGSVGLWMNNRYIAFPASG